MNKDKEIEKDLDIEVFAEEAEKNKIEFYEHASKTLSRRERRALKRTLGIK